MTACHRGLALLLLLLAGSGWAQPAVSVQIVTDSPIPADFGTAYPLGALDNDRYTFGPAFLIRVDYADALDSSLSLYLDGQQEDFLLAWREAGTSQENSPATSLGADVHGLQGSGEGLYYRSDGTLTALPDLATRFQVGVRSTPASSRDLSLYLAVIATLY